MTKKELIKLYIDTHLVIENMEGNLNTAFSALYQDSTWLSVVPSAYSNLLGEMMDFIFSEDELDWLHYYMYEADCKPFVYWDDDGQEVSINSFDDFYSKFFEVN